MQTVFETRKIRLGMLKKQYVKWSILNEAIGWDKTSARLSQIYSGTIRRDRDTAYVMGDTMAREIEVALKLQTGWMDTPPSYAELAGEHDPRAKALAVMEAMPQDQWDTALRLLDALAKPVTHSGTGTNGKDG